MIIVSVTERERERERARKRESERDRKRERERERERKGASERDTHGLECCCRVFELLLLCLSPLRERVSESVCVCERESVCVCV